MAVFFSKREIVIPGQVLADGRYRSSMGTYEKEGKVFSAVVGLAELRGNTVKVVPLQGVYIPREGDFVIGTITIVAGNNWKVEIGGPYLASLHANNALRRPYDDDISRYMDIGDVVAAEVTAFDRNTGPFLSMKGRGLRKLEGGMLVKVSPAKIPRVIGRRGSMINMIKDLLRIQTFVGQNGVIWIRARDIELQRLAVKAFKMIEAEAHTSKLTDRVNDMLKKELAGLKGTSVSDEPSDDTVDEDDYDDFAEDDYDDSTDYESEPTPEAEDEIDLDAEVEETDDTTESGEPKPEAVKAEKEEAEPAMNDELEKESKEVNEE
ncbi:MAG: exosome complex RNA-binding protein Rrp4 [Candidatus Thorarchaeota archaeon]